MCVHLTVGPGGLKTSVTVTVRVRSLAHVRAVEFHPSYVSIASACGVTAVHGQFMFLFAAADLGGARPGASQASRSPSPTPRRSHQASGRGRCGSCNAESSLPLGDTVGGGKPAGGADPGAAASEAAATGPAGDGGPKDRFFFFGRSKRRPGGPKDGFFFSKRRTRPK